MTQNETFLERTQRLSDKFANDLLEVTPELSAVCIVPVWKGGLNRSLNTYGLMFVRKGENPHELSVQLNAASQLTKWQTQLANDAMTQLLAIENMAKQANAVLQELQQQIVQREAELQGLENGTRTQS